MPVELHEKYAPILHFARGERFMPMAAEDLLGYAALYRHGDERPLAATGRVRPEHLHQVAADDTFLRTVEAAPLTGLEVARTWSRDLLELLLAWARGPAAPAYDQGRAQRLYRWFSSTTQLATRLFWWNGLFMSPAVSLRRRGAAAEMPRFRLPVEARDEALQRYEASQKGGRGYTYYYRMARQGDYLNLQYWFLYAYNDWAATFGGLNDHEGDWEGVQLFFRLEEAVPSNRQPTSAIKGITRASPSPGNTPMSRCRATTPTCTWRPGRMPATLSARNTTWCGCTSSSTVPRAAALRSSPTPGGSASTSTPLPG